MIVSHAFSFILLSPWKTASSTCHATLNGFNESRYDRFFHFNAKLNRVVHQHVTLAEVLALPEGTLGYTLAAFVRNPYDRAFSAFLQIQRDASEQPKCEFQEPWIKDLVNAQIAENLQRLARANYDFDRWLQVLPDYEVLAVGRNSNMVLHPAHYWTHVGQQRVDFIGKVENFDADFGRFCDIVGIDAPPMVTSNVSANDNGACERRYSRHAGKMSRASLDRLNALFRKDFELFEYEPL